MDVCRVARVDVLRLDLPRRPCDVRVDVDKDDPARVLGAKVTEQVIVGADHGPAGGDVVRVRADMGGWERAEGATAVLLREGSR